MASTNSSIGLKKIEIADVVAKGLPTAYTELEDVKIGTAILSETEPTINEIYTEQRPNVYRAVTAQEGVTTLSFEIYDVSPATIAKLKGGTVTAGLWKGSKNTISITKSVRVTTLDNYVIDIPNGKVVATLNWTLSKEELASISVKITAQEPSDADLGIIQIKSPTTV